MIDQCFIDCRSMKVKDRSIQIIDESMINQY